MTCCNECVSPITRARRAREARATPRNVVSGFLPASPHELKTRGDSLDGGWSILALDFTRCLNASAANQANLSVDEAFGTDLTNWKIFFQANDAAAWIRAGAEAGLDAQQDTLSAWQTKIRALGCTLTGVVIPPTPQPGPLVNIGSAATFGAGAIAAIAAVFALLLLRK
jgi:hypothetical protein